jgi:hypothetical protein
MLDPIFSAIALLIVKFCLKKDAGSWCHGPGPINWLAPALANQSANLLPGWLAWALIQHKMTLFLDPSLFSSSLPSKTVSLTMFVAITAWIADWLSHLIKMSWSFRCLSTWQTVAIALTSAKNTVAIGPWKLITKLLWKPQSDNQFYNGPNNGLGEAMHGCLTSTWIALERMEAGSNWAPYLAMAQCIFSPIFVHFRVKLKIEF